MPPEKLAEFVAEFRAILDGHGLIYGMFGHADVGCLHVRPALDMKDPADAALIRPVSDAVAALTKKYGGLLWGEHGRGFRGEYSPFFFGQELYEELCRIKTVFDPHNILNPGKLAAPDGYSHIDRIDEVPLRGAFDRAIAPEHARRYDRALACNGNGACFNGDADDPMCPSYKATRDRRQSPKGRAAISANLRQDGGSCSGGLIFAPSWWVADVTNDFSDAGEDFPGRITISMALRIAARRRLCSLQRDSDCAVRGLVFTGGESRERR